ncbi:hypothetical protein ED208_03885 [Stagnimonas aquatica]|uniref:Uncharacterized protein n=2 Tax=Stagnimonas aquatica TaxID=2689987 RepID=A0A3N0VLM9_9GAMM|nr:hypothetical protein ED208_03885 [Stagnimonas aquatica]
MGNGSFSDFQIKPIACIGAIFGIELLKSLVNLSAYRGGQLARRLGPYGALVFSGGLLALIDCLATQEKH